MTGIVVAAILWVGSTVVIGIGIIAVAAATAK
jgi:hypothetical protein